MVFTVIEAFLLNHPQPLKPRMEDQAYCSVHMPSLMFKRTYTVKKGYRFYHPHPGCHSPNSPWLGTGKPQTFFYSV
jgi:hypothetical protein